jgi:uncharacterized protein YkwD
MMRAWGRGSARSAMATALALATCAPPNRPLPMDIAAADASSAKAGPRRPVAPADAGPPPRLTPIEARRYMVVLINRDRASMGLAPVALDDGAATRAGQAHAEDMARNGYLGHWGTDGSVPEERFTEAGGSDMVLENASCFTDEKLRRLDPGARIDRSQVEKTEDMFFRERPPHDGHRKNILKPWHRRVGVGVAQPVSTATELAVPCFAQEFVDAYGTYAPVPRAMRLGDTLHVEGAIEPPAAFAGVGLARVDRPIPIAVDELNRRRSYPVPAPYQMYWPRGYVTPIPVGLAGNTFRVDVPLNDAGRAGLYEVSVWATVPGATELVMVSLRTIRTDPR